ncbi:MAG TPA: hypothetical protein VHG91_09995 [Longimicrobium sp.]|nr:hypothetical protein [Longimicrobium sp.]
MSDFSSSSGIPAPVLRRWVMRAFVVGLLAGVAAGIAALLN